MLSPSVAGPLVHYAVRIGSGTCRVNGTVVLDDMGLAGSLFISAEKQNEYVKKFQFKAESEKPEWLATEECLTHLRPTS
jgi:hypothetical protein